MEKFLKQLIYKTKFVWEERNKVPENCLAIISTHIENTSSDENDNLPIDDIDSSSDGSDIEPVKKRCRQVI